ncbi:MAG TPA: hypothetical protein VGD65_13420 [Chryseosolibacter sp.]
MIKRNDAYILGLIYLAAAFFGFAILRYLYVFLWNVNSTAEDKLVGIRVFLSAPMLILFGIFLIAKFKQDVIHRFFGIVFLLSGLAWAIVIIRTIIEEAA